MDDELRTAGYCGLACKACSVYIASELGGDALAKRAEKAHMTPEEIFCKGCRSEKTSPYCTSCEMKRCIREHGLTWCSECTNYPCKLLTDFQQSLPHRTEIFESLDFASKHTLKEWSREMEKKFTCPNCKTYNSVYYSECRTCGQKPVNEFARIHEELIKKKHNQ